MSPDSTEVAPPVSPEILPVKRVHRPVARGDSSFVSLRKAGYLYVDKTLFIQHVLEDGDQVLLLTRPRRFGKTLNQYLLKAFFGIHNEDYTTLFEDLAIWQNRSAREHFQKHPVLMVSFKDCKGATWAHTLEKIYLTIQELFGEYAYLLKDDAIPDRHKRTFQAIWSGEAPQSAMESSLRFLSTLLERHFSQKVLLLIDEYDSPIHSAVEFFYYQEAILFFRALFSSSLKDNTSLFKAVITGILRISKEGLFSTLNHIGVHTIFSDSFQADFGFTELEVQALLEEFGLSDQIEAVRDMYNGYRMGRKKLVDIYNPWSVLSYLKTPFHPLDPYWMNTGSTALLDQLILAHGDGLRQQLEHLLTGKPITCVYQDDLTFADLKDNPSALFTFLLHAGYLKISAQKEQDEHALLTLETPNREVRQAYRKLARGWLLVGVGRVDARLDRLTTGLLTGNLAQVQDLIEAILVKQCSFMDTAGPQPEKFYHGLVLGLLVLKEREYIVQSNPESGYGRVDLLMTPRAPGHAGVALELKVVEDRPGLSREPLDDALLSALEQVEALRYVTRLETAGASPIFAYGAAFDGKRVRMALLSQKEEVAARVEAARVEAARKAAKSRGSRARGGKKSSTSASTAGAPNPERTPLVHSLTMRERLGLQQATAPLLDQAGLEQLWVLMVQPFQELPRSALSTGFHELVNRCQAAGTLPELAELLLELYPTLAEQPVLARLRSLVER